MEVEVEMEVEGEVEGKMEVSELRYREKSLGYDKEKTIKFTEKTLPS